MCGTQQSKEMSSDLMIESKMGVEEADPKAREKKLMPSGRIGGSVVEHKSSGQPAGIGPVGASSVQGCHAVGTGQGMLKQLLVGKVHTVAQNLCQRRVHICKKACYPCRTNALNEKFGRGNLYQHKKWNSVGVGNLELNFQSGTADAAPC